MLGKETADIEDVDSWDLIGPVKSYLFAVINDMLYLQSLKLADSVRDALAPERVGFAPPPQGEGGYKETSDQTAATPL